MTSSCYKRSSRISKPNIVRGEILTSFDPNPVLDANLDPDPLPPNESGSGPIHRYTVLGAFLCTVSQPGILNVSLRI